MTPASQQVGSLPHCMQLDQQICAAQICFLHLVQKTAVQMVAYPLKRTSNMDATGNYISCSVNTFPELRVWIRACRNVSCRMEKRLKSCPSQWLEI